MYYIEWNVTCWNDMWWNDMVVVSNVRSLCEEGEYERDQLWKVAKDSYHSSSAHHLRKLFLSNPLFSTARCSSSRNSLRGITHSITHSHILHIAVLPPALMVFFQFCSYQTRDLAAKLFLSWGSHMCSPLAAFGPLGPPSLQIHPYVAKTYSQLWNFGPLTNLFHLDLVTFSK